MRSLTVLINVALVSSSMLLSGCGGGTGYKEVNGRVDLTSSGMRQRARYVQQQCTQESMVGTNRSTGLLLDAKRDQFNSIKAGLTFQKRSDLSQKLIGYNAEWQALKNDRDQACRAYAACRFSEQDHDAGCRNTRRDNNRSRTEMLDFITELRQLRISG